MVYLILPKLLDIIKYDFMAVVRDFENGCLDLAHPNYIIITLIPKEVHAKEMNFLDQLA